MAIDLRSLDALKFSAATDPKAAIKETAKQFEALFMQQLMKSMRDASMAGGMLDNEGSRLGTEMLDTQFATRMTGLPGGLSEIIARQLERQMSGAQPAVPAAAGAPAPGAESRKGLGDQAGFVSRHGEAARAAEAATGIPAAFMIAQAAHESGWGRREIRNADGSASNNLFGIKAGPSWKGPVAEVTTTEYVNGEARKVTAKFRAYASAAESFADYARLMKTSPRYTGVVANAGSARGFAQGLQDAGYATDPAYADKLARTINTTLRLQRALS
ncbi:flagellar assembly peptidoglycan hydrolase FlgJ [Piscinibacter sp.]|uniref:flagellar assembly peptidoglycan hydrolase FlgJ n=1 Tax=Piscinibacter sp. TaxID=1903157 RepID=UPI0039E3DC4A